MRCFDTGASRDDVEGKIDYRCLSPAVLQAFGAYMHKHRFQGGAIRAADNWKRGMPSDSYVDSLLRHVLDLWMLHEGMQPTRPETGEQVGWEDALGGCLFNVQGVWLNHLRESIPSAR